ncbi:MAG: hypothetical protein ACD_12C00869G0002 [uncultured bacterium]|nr:MAG: hypothetical protein ACD_12C00869G0002 [uncultured bacterium]
MKKFIIVLVIVLILIGGALLAYYFLIQSKLNDGHIEARDARRIADITTLEIGLDLYYDRNKYYPQNLEELTPNFIGNKLPQDPLPEQYSYQYEPQGNPAKDYELTFYLEKGRENSDSFNKKGYYTVTTQNRLKGANSENTNLNSNLNLNSSQNQNINLNTNRSKSAWEIDTDGDGLSDGEEQKYFTDMRKKDTDDDGYDDKTEVEKGYNPLVNSENKPPSSFADDIPIYENEEIIQSSNYQNKEKGGNLIAVTNDTPETIKNYYDDKLVKNGWNIDSESFYPDNDSKPYPQVSLLLLGAKKDNRYLLISVDGTDQWTSEGITKTYKNDFKFYINTNLNIQ